MFSEWEHVNPRDIDGDPQRWQIAAWREEHRIMMRGHDVIGTHVFRRVLIVKGRR